MLYPKALHDFLNQYPHYYDTFINYHQDSFTIASLPVLKPQNTQEWEQICHYMQETHQSFKLIKGLQKQFVNPGHHQDACAVDVSLLDTHITLENETAACLPGTTIAQLNSYLEIQKTFYRFPLALELHDPLIIYNQGLQQPSIIKCTLPKHQADTRWLVIGFDALQDLYQNHEEVIHLKKKLGHLIVSLFYLNQASLKKCQKIISRHHALHTEQFPYSSKIEKSPWFLVIEIVNNPYLVPGILAIIKEQLHHIQIAQNDLLNKLKQIFSIKQKPETNTLKSAESEQEQTFSVTFDNNINTLLYAYHALYTENPREHWKVHILIDSISEKKISLSAKIAYESRQEKEEVLRYWLHVINRLQLKM